MAISTTHDIVPDSPTNTFATLNPLFQVGAALSNGNLRISDNSSNPYFFRPTTVAFVNVGKWYAEFYYESVNNNSDIYIKVHHDGLNLNDNRELSIRSTATAARIYSEVVTTTYNSATGTVNNGSIVGVLVDFDNYKVIFNENGAYSGEASITSNDNYNYYFGVGFDNVPGTKTVIANFGQDSTFNAGTSAGSVTDENGYGLFKHTPVNSGSAQIKDFKALCTANLPSAPDLPIDPNVDDVPEDYFKAKIWTGTGYNRNITLGFQPDLVWIKSRGIAYNSGIYDSVRGAGANKELISHLTYAEGQQNFEQYDWVDSFDDGIQTGFSIDSESSSNTGYSEGYLNVYNRTYVGWCWKAGGAPTTDNTATSGAMTANSVSVDGTLQSSYTPSGSPTIYPKRMSVNTKAGFSIIKYTGTGSAATVPHGLSSAPEMIIVKNIDTDGYNWLVGHTGIGLGSGRLWLNLPSSNDTNYANDFWGSTAPTSTTISFGTNANCNNQYDSFIAYCWHSVAGYSAFGSYTGNGSADGPFVYTGFKPAWVMVKNIDSSGNWTILDNKRGSYNVNGQFLAANLSNEESFESIRQMDFLSNGFKIRGNSTVYFDVNNTNDNFIYAAFAEMPFRYSATNAR